jgi:SAM-dependent methyltransferase
MRKELLQSLRDPVNGEPLTLHITHEDSREVRAGELVSASGKHRYAITDGVAELLPFSNLDQQTRTERNVRDEKRRDWAVERQRPYLNDNPTSPWIWPGFAANVEQGLAQVALRGKRTLDVGCATCWSTRMICEQGAWAVALDISTGILRDGEAQFATGAYFDRIAATMTQLPFQDASFDVIFASASVHHASDLTQTFREFARVTTHTGQMVLVNEPVLGILRSGESFGKDEIEQGMNEHIYRLADYVSAARSAGFEAHALFPADLEAQLSGRNPAPPGPIRRLKPLWPLVSSMGKDGLMRLGHWLIGLSLVLVGRKVNRGN